MYNEIKNKLKDFPDFRERRFREKYLTKLALRSCGLEGNWKENSGLISLEELAEFAHTFTSYDRIWRKVLRENPELRGEDYGEDDGTKEILEQKKMEELNYSPNYYQDIKTLKLL